VAQSRAGSEEVSGDGRHTHDRTTGLLETTGLGAVAALALPTRLAGAQLSEAERANVAIVGDFCAAWATRDMAKPLAFMSDDCVYRMTETTPPATGHQGVRDRLQSFVDASERVEFQILETFLGGRRGVLRGRRPDQGVVRLHDPGHPVGLS